jgi:hypothetical protein
VSVGATHRVDELLFSASNKDLFTDKLRLLLADISRNLNVEWREAITREDLVRVLVQNVQQHQNIQEFLGMMSMWAKCGTIYISCL